MATVRLFARLRELAGSSRLVVEGETVGDVVEAVGRKVGPDFVSALASARVWRNGEEADPSDPVSDDDEIALLPPVSGGAVAVGRVGQIGVAVPWVVAAALVLVDRGGDDALWAALVVAVAGLWVIDVAVQMERRARPFPTPGVLIGVLSGAVMPHLFGTVGMAVAIAFAVMAVLGWGVAVEGQRSIEGIAPGVLVSVVATAAASSLVLARSPVSPDPEAIGLFLIVVIAATAAGAAVERLADLPYLDPLTVTAIGAILVAVGTAFVWDLDVAGYLLVGLGAAITLVAGRGLGSLLRLGAVLLTQPNPGYLRAIDGPLLTAAVLFPLIRLVL